MVISSDKENEFVRKLAKENIIWLGGTDEFEEGTWTWDNGEDFKFKNWDDNQPSGSSGHNFLTLNGKNGKWADTTDFSGKVKGYVCEWKGTAPKSGTSKTLNNFDSQINRLIRIERSILRTKIETGRTRSLTEQFPSSLQKISGYEGLKVPRRVTPLPELDAASRIY